MKLYGKHQMEKYKQLSSIQKNLQKKNQNNLDPNLLTENSHLESRLFTDYHSDNELLSEQNSLRSLWKKLKIPTSHSEEVIDLIFEKETKETNSVVFTEIEFLSSGSHPIIELEKFIKIKKRCMKSLVSKSLLFNDEQYFGKTQQLLQGSIQVFQHLRTINLKIVRCYAKWRTYLLFLKQISDGKKVNVEEDYIYEFPAYFHKNQNKIHRFNSDSEELFTMLKKDQDWLAKSVWAEHFSLKPNDIFLLQAGISDPKENKRSITLDEEETLLIKEL